MWAEKAHGAAAFAAARCAWGVKGSNGVSHLCPKRGMVNYP